VREENDADRFVGQGQITGQRHIVALDLDGTRSPTPLALAHRDRSL
jgi:hypothetical protein